MTSDINTCPSCGKRYTKLIEGGDPPQMECYDCGRIYTVPQSAFVTCKFCGKPAEASTAHLHDGQYVGDECCWDERLRTTE